MKTIFKDEKIKVLRTENDYDFIAVVENKTDKEVQIIFDNEEFSNFTVSANDYVGLLANDDGYEGSQQFLINCKIL